MDTYDEDLESLLAELEQRFPDPVDAFENRLAGRLGLYRGPGLSDEAWRRLRASFIDASEKRDTMI